MLYALIDGVRRQPIKKGERTTCSCGGELYAVIPVENVRHWRHKNGDCDLWGEPEGPWHLDWKERFDIQCREIDMVDELSGERHRADIVCGQGTTLTTVLELQHSYISEEDCCKREAFYMRKHRMFWLVHLHDEFSFTGTNFALSLGIGGRVATVNGHIFKIVHFAGRSSQFIEKWKRSTASVFFDYKGHIFFLAGETVSTQANGGVPLKKGYFAYCKLTQEKFIQAVHGRR